MLRKAKDLFGFHIRATDGEIGKVHDFYFDEQTWAVRYLVVDVGSWLLGRHVLVAPAAVAAPDWTDKVIPVQLTKEQVEHSPDIDLDKPVERQHEIQLSSYYGWPMYWSGDPMLYGMGGGMDALAIAEQQTVAEENAAPDKQGDPDLHSVEGITGYIIQAADGDIGHVSDFIVDEEAWAIRYLLIDTNNWLPGKQVLAAPAWIQQIDWSEAKLQVKVTREQIKQSPAYDRDAPLTLSSHGVTGQPANDPELYQSDALPTDWSQPQTTSRRE